MNELKCPKCGEVFRVDESDYAELLKTVRNEEFERAIREKETLILAQHSAERERWEAAAAEERNSRELETQKKIAAKEADLIRLQAEIRSEEQKREDAVRMAVAQKEKELADLTFRLEQERSRNAMERKELELESERRLSGKDEELVKMRTALASAEQEKRDAVALATERKEREISEAKHQLEQEQQLNAIRQQAARQEMEKELSDLRATMERNAFEASLREEHQRKAHEEEMKRKDETIEYYKDLKLSLSTKMLGETLEQHCENEFNRLRATAFRNAYFEKDNDARTGSKGDYIFRDREDGVEYVSIMFEMKNEADATATKKKNVDFLKELDKDRREKNCEYAVLVSLLEADSELYNGGIVDMSHLYEKTYVIRPQFFLPLIALIRDGARNSLQYRKELAVMRSQNVDVTNFEAALEDFKARVSRDYTNAGNQYNSALEYIDDAIKKLEKIKESLRLFDHHLRLANDKAQDLSVKKLTRNNPTMQAKFAALKNNGEPK